MPIVACAVRVPTNVDTGHVSMMRMWRLHPWIGDDVEICVFRPLVLSRVSPQGPCFLTKEDDGLRMVNSRVDLPHCLFRQGRRDDALRNGFIFHLCEEQFYHQVISLQWSVKTLFFNALLLKAWLVFLGNISCNLLLYRVCNATFWKR